jgi:hypothetical protein
MRTLLGLVLAMGWLSLAKAAAQEKLAFPKEESLAPAAVAPLPIVVLPAPHPPTGFYRISAYEHWQHRAVGWDGRFHLRVLTTPEGRFYSYNGQPYPFYVESSQLGRMGTAPPH